ncbi:hypothetical protein HHI36_003137 [Cryptolaemus montrouzieri]|uniref:Uncharacterized protein n=1 Tax=Cryptolaemus montrouzieri TaxID=559131 RepID=A0ABD2PDF3_9CUCU
MKIHQFTWCHTENDFIRARRLSCFECSLSDECSHYGLGTIRLQIIVKRPIYSAVYSDSEPETEKGRVEDDSISNNEINTISFEIIESPAQSKVYYVRQIQESLTISLYGLIKKIVVVPKSTLVHIFKKQVKLRRGIYHFQDENSSSFHYLK